MDAREAAWSAIHDRLPPRWRIGPPTWDPGARRWEVVAMSPNRGRRKVWEPPEYVTGSGDSEVAALEDLVAHLAAVHEG